jgi:tight adherence protein C
MQEAFYYPVGAAVLVFIAAPLYYQRTSSRRAAVATLRSATAWASAAQAPARPQTRVATTSSEQAEVRGTSRPTLSVVAALGRLGHRLSPPAYSATRERRLQLAGKGRFVDQERFFALRLVTLAAVAPASALELLLPLRGLYALLSFIMVATLLGLGPEALLNHLVSERQQKIRRDLPALVELLMISVEAGLGFDQALARSVTSVPGPLSEEFSRYLGEVRMGSGHREALEAIDRRTGVDELRSFLMALAQAETFGISIGSILRAQAKESRAAQHQHAQERAQKAPVKMLFPLVFCVLPALFVVVLGPATIEIYRDLIK